MSNQLLDDVAVVIPAFNESTRIQETINELTGHFKNIFVVDDGSKDNTYLLAKSLNCVLIKHPINLGQGAALQTGIIQALMTPHIEYIITFDADGQHSVESAINMAQEIKNSGVDIVLGSRFKDHDPPHMPKKKKLILKLAIAFTRIDSGLNVTDTHNGLRIFNRKFAQSLKLQHAGMAHASEFFSHIQDTNAKWKEYPVQIFYTDYSLRKGQ